MTDTSRQNPTEDLTGLCKYSDACSLYKAAKIMSNNPDSVAQLEVCSDPVRVHQTCYLNRSSRRRD